MNWTFLLSALPLATIMSVTPGPNNLMCAASGVNFGFRRTIPQIVGVGVGYIILFDAIGFGLATVFSAMPLLRLVLKILGIIYILIIAYELARTRTRTELSAAKRPISFFNAVLFQWINPKAWLGAISVITGFVRFGLDRNRQVLALGISGGFLALFAVCIWTVFGTMIAHKLSTPRAIQNFNVAMALLLVASLAPVIWG